MTSGWWWADHARMDAERLRVKTLDAYGHGIFPWPLDEETPIAWWSPDPRAIIVIVNTSFTGMFVYANR